MKKRLFVVATLVLACLIGWGAWIWSHPHVLKNTSALGNAKFDPRPVGTTYYVGVAGSSARRSPETVTLRKVTAHLALNSAKAEVSTYICRTRGTEASGAVTDRSVMSEVCASFKPFEPGQKLRVFSGAGRDEIVLKIVPNQPGRTRIDRVSFSYTRDRNHLWQRGTDTSEQDWQITAR